MTFDKYLAEVERHLKRRPDWRRGQAHFNTLAVNRADLAQQVRGSIRDPYNNDAKVPDYLTWTAEHWDMEAKS